MDLSYTVLTLKNGHLQIPYLNDKQLVDEIEKITGVVSVCQHYYRLGNKINLAELQTQELKYLEMVPLRKENARYFIKTPSMTLKLSILKPSEKKIFHLIPSFSSECRYFSVSFPINEYVFTYNSEILPLDYPLSRIPSESQIDLIHSPAYGDLKYHPISIKTLTGRKISITVSETDSVEELKIKILRETGIPIDKQRLVFAGFKLEDTLTLGSYNITDGSILYMVMITRGGSCPKVFTFNDMSQEIKLEFPSNVPGWRVVEKGISWHGNCRNIQCKALNSEVISNFKFGVMNVKTISVRVRCPICEQGLSDVLNCGFFMAAWEFIGVDHNGIERTGSGEANEDNYKTFLDGENEEWQSLLIEVRPLDY